MSGYGSSQEVFEDEPEVSRLEAQHEVLLHHADWDEFVREHGDHDTYNGAVVLGWLGY